MSRIRFEFEVSIRRADWKGPAIERKIVLEIPPNYFPVLPLGEMAGQIIAESVEAWELKGEPRGVPDEDEAEQEPA